MLNTIMKAPVTPALLSTGLTLALAACNGPPPSTTANSMTSAGATEPAADNIAAPVNADGTAEGVSTPIAAPTQAAARDYTGRWIGVEGMFLNVTRTGPNTVALEMQYDLDHRGRYPATITPDGLRFERDRKTLLLRPSDGNATGLKWLRDKKDCLTVSSGEGYCRA